MSGVWRREANALFESAGRKIMAATSMLVFQKR